MPDQPGSPGADEPSEADVRAYLDQLRAAPVDQVVAEVASALVNAAQLKVGRRDARLLIDVVAAITESIRGRVPDELVTQLDQALTQLRLAQVEGEQQVAAAAGRGEHEANDTPDEGPTEPPQGGHQPPPGEGRPGDGGAGSRLWVPGT